MKLLCLCFPRYVIGVEIRRESGVPVLPAVVALGLADRGQVGLGVVRQVGQRKGTSPSFLAAELLRCWDWT